jgi:hypothetical protein
VLIWERWGATLTISHEYNWTERETALNYQLRLEQMRSIIIAAIVFIALFAYRILKANRGRKLLVTPDYLEVGQLLFPTYKSDFDNFFGSFASNKTEFLSEHEELLQDYDNFELEKLKAIEVLYIFGDSKKQLWLTDWRGEENESEIESFIEKHLNQKLAWTNTSTFRADNTKVDQRDGGFVIELFKKIDKDLQQINQRLIFFSLGWDSYVFTTVDTKSFDHIVSKMPSDFEGANQLKK